MDRYTCLYFLGSVRGYRNTVGLLIYWMGGYISVYNAENKQTELLLYEGEPNTTCVYIMHSSPYLLDPLFMVTDRLNFEPCV